MKNSAVRDRIVEKTLEKKREAALSFLERNVRGARVERAGNVIRFRNRGAAYEVILLSRQSDFPVQFTENPDFFDEDSRRLTATFATLVDRVREINGRGARPFYVVLGAAVDYDALQVRVQALAQGTAPPNDLVNHGHFDKQTLPSRRTPNPRWSYRTLDPIEVALMTLYWNSTSQKRSGSRLGPGFSHLVFRPGLPVYNPVESRLEWQFYADRDAPSGFRRETCPVCEYSNQDRSHLDCKSMPQYVSWVRRRDHARYDKVEWVSRSRLDKDAQTSVEARKGVRLREDAVQGDRLERILGAPQSDLSIALLRGCGTELS